MIIKFLRFLPFVLLATVITSCASVPRADHELDSQAKSFNVEKGMSNIYIYRNETDNFNTTMSVELDGQHAGDTEQRTFIVKSVTPGKHVITAHGENTSEIEITTEEDKNHFVWLEITVGAVIPRAKLHSVSKDKGMSGVKESDLVK